MSGSTGSGPVIGMGVTNAGIQLKWTHGIAGPCLDHSTHPKTTQTSNFNNFGPISMKLGGEAYGMAGAMFSPPNPVHPETILFISFDYERLSG